MNLKTPHIIVNRTYGSHTHTHTHKKKKKKKKTG